MKTAKLGLGGRRPSARIQPIDPDQPRVEKVLTEKEKYTKMWRVDEYRKVAPGELAAQTFLSLAKPKDGEEVIDFGCGTGRSIFPFLMFSKLNITLTDFAPNCLDDVVRKAIDTHNERITFIEHDLTRDPVKYARYGYCTDVMEHIPEDDVDLVLMNIMESARSVFFRISTTPDVMGPKYLKQHLHLTVHDYAWWCAKFAGLGATILHSEDLGGAVDFYVTAWSKKLPDKFLVNTPREKILENIEVNAKWGCKHVRPHMPQDIEVMLLCGGPSLNDFEEEIWENYHNGMKVVTVNGAYQWCQERGITNVNQCMLDARPFNRRFVEPVREDCYYFIASQCDPSVYEILPKHRTFYWHCTTNDEAIAIIDKHYPEYVLCGGGSTVALRALVLLRILGFKNQLIYGMDSCLRNDEHHAYLQAENDSTAPVVPVMVGDKTFFCHRWMAYQAFEFIDMMRGMSEEFSLTVKGDGLIAHILETGAELPQLEET